MTYETMNELYNELYADPEFLAYIKAQDEAQLADEMEFYANHPELTGEAEIA